VSQPGPRPESTPQLLQHRVLLFTLHNSLSPDKAAGDVLQSKCLGTWFAGQSDLKEGRACLGLRLHSSSQFNRGVRSSCINSFVGVVYLPHLFQYRGPWPSQPAFSQTESFIYVRRGSSDQPTQQHAHMRNNLTRQVIGVQLPPVLLAIKIRWASRCRIRRHRNRKAKPFLSDPVSLSRGRQ